MKVLHRIGIVSLISFAFAAPCAKADDYAVSFSYYVVGVKNYLKVHSDPGEESEVLTRIPRAVSEVTGYPSRVYGQKWILIEWNGIRGYVNKSYLEKSN